jgi:hypothetical protein
MLGDDHIYQNAQFVRFLRAQAAPPEGQAGQLERFFNGHFLEFAQTNQGAFFYTSDEYWVHRVIVDGDVGKYSSSASGYLR